MGSRNRKHHNKGKLNAFRKKVLKVDEVQDIVTKTLITAGAVLMTEHGWTKNQAQVLIDRTMKVVKGEPKQVKEGPGNDGGTVEKAEQDTGDGEHISDNISADGEKVAREPGAGSETD